MSKNRRNMTVVVKNDNMQYPVEAGAAAAWVPKSTISALAAAVPKPPAEKGRKRKSAAVEDAIPPGPPEDIVTISAGNQDFRFNMHQPLPIQHVNLHRLQEYVEKKNASQKVSKK